LFFFDKKISNLIESQFPAHYRDAGPNFVAFVKAYYEWMEEEGNANYHARRLLEYRDVDSTVDQFLKYFKSKYLNNIQFDTAVSTPSFVKHSLDLYRSKGTERAIDLFFKSVFGVPADVYFPAKDIFKTSSGIWVEPKYLEIEPSDNVLDFVGLQIEGLDSGAKAFVEKYVRKFSADTTHVAHVYFISSITGLFQTGERVRASTNGMLGPIVIGSMTSLDILTGASGFEIGDIVDITSTNNGRNGKARVAEVITTSGKVSFELENGGWGYNSNSEIIVSEKMLVVSNLVNSSADVSFTQFETVSQPLANIHYVSLTGDQFLEGDRVVRMDGSNVIADAVVVSIDRVSNTEGYVLVSTASSKFDLNFDVTMEDGDTFTTEDGFTLIFEEDNSITSDGKLYKVETTIDEAGDELSLEDLTQFLIEGSVGSANVSGYVDVTASANVMKFSANVSVEIVGGSDHFVDGMEVFQYSNSLVEVANATIDTASYFGSNATLRLTNVSGKFNNGTLHARSSTTNAEIVSITVNVGLFNVDNDFIDTDYAPIYGLTSNTYGRVSSVSQGFGASISISNTFLFEETVAINTDDVGDYLNVQLDSSDYGFPASGSETILTLLEDAFSYNIEDYGRISSIVVTNSGEDYNFSPYVIIYEKDLYAYNKRDFIVNVSNVAGTFVVGETVQQAGVNKGIVKEGSNSSVLFLERITFGELDEPVRITDEDGDVLFEEGGLDLSGETTDVLVGLTSAATAEVDYVYADESSDPIGINALIAANTATSNGTVSRLEVVSSGFGYYDGELVTFSIEGNDDTGTAHVELLNQGIAQGYHRENNSLLSANKYIQDGYYYQEFSYEVRSSVVLEKYSDMLKNVVHVAGTKFFSKFVFESDLTATVSTEGSVLTIS
jgi:hypothetical protein